MEEIEITLEQEPNEEQEIELISEGTLIYPSLENLAITPSSEEQIFNHPNSYGYDKVVVEAVTSEELNIMPSTEEQVNEGMFNKVTVAGDSNLIADNIKSGASIFGVDGNAVVCDFEINDCSYLFYNGARIGSYDSLLALCKDITSTAYMFYYCRSITSLDFSKINTSNNKSTTYMFFYCNALEEINLTNFDTSNVTVMSCMFSNCTKLKSIDVSNFDTSKVGNMYNMFFNCSSLEIIDISNFDGSALTNNNQMFSGCTKLKTLIIDNPNVFKMFNTNMFKNTPIESGTGYVYVPDDMVETYKSATNWSNYANQIKGISELPTEEA